MTTEDTAVLGSQPVVNEDELFVPAEYSREEAERITYSNYSYWRSTITTFSKKKAAMALLILMVLITIFSVIQPYLPGQFPEGKSAHLNEIDRWKEPPSAEHWFGTDATGRDMWARVWAGTRLSLSLAIIVAVSETLIGIIVGALWGYVRQLDRAMTEIYNVIANIPSLVLHLLMAYILRPGFWTMVIVMVVTGWIYMARYVRNMVTIIRDREYNLASRSLGTPVKRMLSRNLIPHLISVIIMRLAVTIPAVIGTEVGLTYLGVGFPATWSSLGVLVNNGQQVFMTYPHLLVYPALFVSVIAVSFYVVGNAFSDASDPRNHM